MVLNVLCGWLIGEHCKTPVRGFVYQGSTKYDLIVTDWEVANVAIFHINLVWLFRLNPTLFLAGGSQPQEPQCQELLGRYIIKWIKLRQKQSSFFWTLQYLTLSENPWFNHLLRFQNTWRSFQTEYRHVRISQCHNITQRTLPWLGGRHQYHISNIAIQGTNGEHWVIRQVQVVSVPLVN